MNVNTSLIYQIFEKHEFLNILSTTAFKGGNDISFCYREYDPFGLALCVDIKTDSF